MLAGDEEGRLFLSLITGWGLFNKQQREMLSDIERIKCPASCVFLNNLLRQAMQPPPYDLYAEIQASSMLE
jgi:hypothetical protein